MKVHGVKYPEVVRLEMTKVARENLVCHCNHTPTLSTCPFTIHAFIFVPAHTCATLHPVFMLFFTSWATMYLMYMALAKNLLRFLKETSCLCGRQPLKKKQVLTLACLFVEQQGKVYYWNTKSDKTQWAKPASFQPSANQKK